MSNIEYIAHIRVNDRDFNVYISFCNTSMTLHGYKYNEYSIEYEWFSDIVSFQIWVQKPLKRIYY